MTPKGPWEDKDLAILGNFEVILTCLAQFLRVSDWLKNFIYAEKCKNVLVS